MKNRLMKWMATPLLLLLVALAAQAQEEAPEYDPFVSTNLNDPAKLSEGTVVASSYRYFKVAGDQNFTEVSTFVWFVQNGTFGTYDDMKDEWTELSTGSTFELEGKFINGVGNSSEIWVKWDEDSGGKTGYVAVYERSSTNCILDNAITGFKLNIVAPPEAWFADATQGECAEEQYSVQIIFKNVYTDYYPYVLSYTYPDYNGFLQEGGMLVVTEDMLTANPDGTYMYWLELNSLRDVDGTYTLKLDRLRDNKRSDGVLPNNPAQNQHKELNLTIYHLPKTEGMTME